MKRSTPPFCPRSGALCRAFPCLALRPACCRVCVGSAGCAAGCDSDGMLCSGGAKAGAGSKGVPRWYPDIDFRAQWFRFAIEKHRQRNHDRQCNRDGADHVERDGAEQVHPELQQVQPFLLSSAMGFSTALLPLPQPRYGTNQRSGLYQPASPESMPRAKLAPPHHGIHGRNRLRT